MNKSILIPYGDVFIQDILDGTADVDIPDDVYELILELTEDDDDWDHMMVRAILD